MGTTPAPREVIDLVARFDRNRDSYLAGGINETQLRREFIDPFFSCLGWDIENKQGYAPAYREVIFEDSLRVGAETKAPDYCFRIGGMRKFFVEAKKPAVNIATGVAPAFQLKRYAWTAKLPLSILTDFEEFAVYDCRARPFKTDKSSIGRIKFLEFKDYPVRWTELYDTFSRDAVVKGSFDKFVEENRARKGTTEVDDAFLSDIERWRDLLARNIALRNPRLLTRELNFAVQRTIDRIIFLRICEDRLIEPYGQLQALLNGERVYPRLKEAFQRADDRYNSGIFHFRPEKNRPEAPDELSLKLSIDDKTLKDIIANLYYPDSPYEFSVFPSEILGQVYEQFLGKVIRLTAGHQAKVEDKPEVRKAGGVYYTPTYIVDYIVKNTVGKLLEGNSSSGTTEDTESTENRARSEKSRSPTPNPRPLTPAQASRLRILDPACGSGSFLLGAYQYLLNWHRDWYVKDGPEKHTKELFPAQGGDWRLTTAKKKEILLNNIYGVDIDQQAVEVTKLSLLLKVLEGENEQTIQSQLKLFQERALPDLGNNIKCGNSLIGPGFYQGEQQSLFDDEEQRFKVNAFDWQAEFPDIMKCGGFDAVIGNPPYVEFKRLDAETKSMLAAARFTTTTGKYDLYIPFMEKGINLLRARGVLGFIVPTMFTKRDYGNALRAFLKRSASPEVIVDFGDFQVFRGATNYVGIFTFRKQTGDAPCLCMAARVGRGASAAEIEHDLSSGDVERSFVKLKVPRASLGSAPWMFTSQASSALLDSVRTRANITRLGNVMIAIWEGIASGKDEVFYLRADECRRLGLERGITLPLLRGRDVKAWTVAPKEVYRVVYPYSLAKGKVLSEAELKTKYPRAYAYLVSKRELLGGRTYFKDSGKLWFELWCPRDPTMFASPKLVVPEIAQDNSFAYDEQGAAFNTKVYGLAKLDSTQEEYDYVLGVLNSRLLDFLYKLAAPRKAGGYFAYKTQFLVELPYRRIDFTDSTDKARHDKMVSLVERMLKLHKDLPKARTAPDKTAIERQIAATDRQIDQLVYELYGLTQEEVRIVESHP